MTRATYLQTLKNGLFIFVESYQQQKILEVDERISSFMEQGKTEEEALQAIGNVEDYLSVIYQENHITYPISSPKKSF